jgi:hypothetical protein
MIHIQHTQVQATPQALYDTMRNGSRVYPHGLVRRVYIKTPCSGDWYELTAHQNERGQLTHITSRREDCKTPQPVSGSSIIRFMDAIKEEVRA